MAYLKIVKNAVYRVRLAVKEQTLQKLEFSDELHTKVQGISVESMDPSVLVNESKESFLRRIIETNRLRSAEKLIENWLA